MGVAAFVLGFRFFDHYWFQALPPLCLLAGLTTAGLRVEVLAVLAVAALVPAALAWRDAWQPHAFGADWSSVVATIRSHTGPGDRVTVWGSVPELYWLSGATRVAAW